MTGQAQDGKPVEGGAATADEVARFQAAVHESTPRVFVVWGLVALIAVAFVVTALAGVSLWRPTGDSLIPWGANYGPLTLRGQPWRLLASTFLHFGIIHIVANGIGLLNVGPLVERLYGHGRFAVIYLTAGLLGSVTSVALHPQVVSAGASGAVFGVYGALAAFLIKERGTIPKPILSSLSKAAMAFIGYNVVFGFSQPGIDNAAHLGGLLSGGLAGLWLSRPLGAGVTRAGGVGRSLATLVVAIGIAAAATAALPEPADTQAVFRAFFDTEKVVIDAYNDMITRARAGRLSAAQSADEIEAKVLPPWRAAMAGLQASGTWPKDQAKLLGLIQRYAKSREQAWSSYVQASRTQDETMIERAHEHEAETARLLEEIEKLGR